MIRLIEQGICDYINRNNVYRDEIIIYIHPIVKRYLLRYSHDTHMYHQIVDSNDITIMGVPIVNGYDLKNIVISSPELYNREPLLINIDLLINL